MQQAYVYCPYCGNPLEPQPRFQQVRPVCPQCGYVYFCDPKVAVTGMVICHSHVLLVRRGVEPERGKWALPGGYMDAHEMPESALAREIREEVGISISDLRLVEIFPMTRPQQENRGIVLVYSAAPASGTLDALAGHDDVLEARWFRAGALPVELAFESTVTLLHRWQQQISE